MAYGTVKVDNITFTNGGIDQTVTVSGIVQSISGNITATGTIQAATIIGTSTVSGATVTGDSGQYGNLNSISGVFTTQLSGATITGDIGQYATLTGVSGVFTTQISGATITGDTIQASTVTGISGVYTTQLSGATITGNTGSFTTVTGGVATITSGVFALGTNALPSISFSSDPNTGIYSPGADQVAISTNGTGRLFVDANGNVEVKAGNLTLGPVGAEGGQLNIRNTTNTGTVYALDASTDANARLFTTINNCDLQIGQLAGTGGTIQLFTGSSERLRITSTGELTHIGSGSVGDPAVYFAGSAPAKSLYVEATTGRVGLGTSSPGTKLHLIGDVRAAVSDGTSAGTVRYALNSDNGGYDMAQITATQGAAFTNPVFKIRVSDTSKNLQDRLTIDSSGRVGVGTTSPQQLLEISDSGNVRQIIRNTTENTSYACSLDFATGSGSLGSSNVVARAVGLITSANPSALAGELQFQVNTGDDVQEAARIDSSRRLLVGTSSVSNTNITMAIQGSPAGSTNGPQFLMKKNAATPADGESIGSLAWSDNTDTVSLAITGRRDGGTWSASSKPSRLEFSTTADGASSPTEQLRITSNRYVRLASGTGGIQFNGDTAAANALDDYEEGTWTPVVTSSTNTSGRYTKIGNKVHLQCTIFAIAGSTFTVSTIGGLPFAVSGSFVYPVPVGVYTVVNGNGGGTGPNNFIQSGNLYINNTKNTLVIQTSINRAASGGSGGEVLCIGFTYLI